jgi:hypothetical protein
MVRRVHKVHTVHMAHTAGMARMARMARSHLGERLDANKHVYAGPSELTCALCRATLS